MGGLTEKQRVEFGKDATDATASEPPLRYRLPGRLPMPTILARATGALTLSQAFLELELVEEAYLALLRLPHGATRLGLQSVLATLRDQIADMTAQEPEEVQNDFEKRACAKVLP